MPPLDAFPLKDIIITEAFKNTTPARSKMERREAQYKERGELPTDIIINSDNVLIDGYCSYLLAMAAGLDTVPVKRGMVEIVEANHTAGQKLYSWRVPAHLVGQIAIGDRVLVRTATGVKRIRVQNISRPAEPPQRAIRSVIRKA